MWIWLARYPALGGEGFRYMLSIINRNTCWFELAPLTDITTESALREDSNTYAAKRVLGLPL